MAGLPGDTAGFVLFQVTSQAGRKPGRLLIGPGSLAAKSYVGACAVVCSRVLLCFDQKLYFKSENLPPKKIHLYI